MSELIVFAFPSEAGASEMDETIHQLKKEELMVLVDHFQQLPLRFSANPV